MECSKHTYDIVDSPKGLVIDIAQKGKLMIDD